MTKNLLRILVFSWKDIEHPKAGGAEEFVHQVFSRLTKKGYSITHISPRIANGAEKELIDGIVYKRIGTPKTVYYKAYQYYKTHKDSFDIVIDHINTVPFFTPLYAKKRVGLIHQLADKVWFYQLNPIIGVFGYFAEKLYMRFYRNTTMITVSHSTQKDLMKLGISRNHIHISPEGLSISIKKKISDNTTIKKLGYFGSIRPMKRVLDIVKAFAIIVKKYPELSLHIAGGGDKAYISKIKKYIFSNNLQNSVSLKGYVPDNKKIEFYDSLDVLLVASIVEGWCLVASEAHARGVPTVVYNVNGLRDSTIHDYTGRVSNKNTPAFLAEEVEYLIKNPKQYNEMRINCLHDIKNLTWNNAAEAVENVISSQYYLK